MWCSVLGYLFWTLFQALAPMIWFYPLNELEISGFEAFAICLFSPALVALPFVRHILSGWWTIAFLRSAFDACKMFYSFDYFNQSSQSNLSF